MQRSSEMNAVSIHGNNTHLAGRLAIRMPEQTDLHAKPAMSRIRMTASQDERGMNAAVEMGHSRFHGM